MVPTELPPRSRRLASLAQVEQSGDMYNGEVDSKAGNMGEGLFFGGLCSKISRPPKDPLLSLSLYLYLYLSLSLSLVTAAFVVHGTGRRARTGISEIKVDQKEHQKGLRG